MEHFLYGKDAYLFQEIYFILQDVVHVRQNDSLFFSIHATIFSK